MGECVSRTLEPGADGTPVPEASHARVQELAPDASLSTEVWDLIDRVTAAGVDAEVKELLKETLQHVLTMSNTIRKVEWLALGHLKMGGRQARQANPTHVDGKVQPGRLTKYAVPSWVAMLPDDLQTMLPEGVEVSCHASRDVTEQARAARMQRDGVFRRYGAKYWNGKMTSFKHLDNDVKVSNFFQHFLF